jgi:uncharacterized protein
VFEAVTLVTSDGVTLEGELARAAGTARAATVLCHPHPLHGGSMRSIVIGALFRELPGHGVTCLRMNFRGVGASEGSWDEGDGERIDARAALAQLRALVRPGTPLVMTGWSFGGDIALGTVDDDVAGWIAIAPPLRWGDFTTVASSSRPKLLVLGERDQITEPQSTAATASSWTSTTVDLVPGADHYFVGRTDRVVVLATSFLDGLV